MKIYLKIIDKIKAGKYPAKIADDLDISRQRLNYYIKVLKKNNCINPTGGYTIWNYNNKAIEEFFQKKLTKTKKVKHAVEVPGHIRGHGFHFKLSLPFEIDLNTRKKILDSKKIEYEIVGHKYNRWLNIRLKDWHPVRLNKVAVNAYFSKDHSIYGIDAKDIFLEAMHRFRGEVIKPLEVIFNRSFQQKSRKGLQGYKIKTCKEHYALINNLEAKAIHDDKRKLYIRGEDGVVWLITDESHARDEMELIQAGKAPDHTTLIDNHYNSIKDTQMDYHKVLNLFGKTQGQINNIVENQNYYAENLKSHVAVIRELGAGVRQLTKTVNNKSKVKTKQKTKLNRWF